MAMQYFFIWLCFNRKIIHVYMSEIVYHVKKLWLNILHYWYFDCQKYRFNLRSFSLYNSIVLVAVKNCKKCKTYVFYNSKEYLKFSGKRNTNKICTVTVNICSVETCTNCRNLINLPIFVGTFFWSRNYQTFCGELIINWLDNFEGKIGFYCLP